VAVSGGADSSALALLAEGWVRQRGGTCLALIVDHGLRAGAADEAALARDRMAALGMAARILSLRVQHGTRLAERARAARLEALQAACAEAGILHLLLGHHAADQAETVAMRMLRGSHADGLSGMAALVETARVRLLRPLLTVPPLRLRRTLEAAGVAWSEDPSNRDPRWQRARLRALRRDTRGVGAATLGAVRAAGLRGSARALRDAERAEWLGRHAALRGDGALVLDALPADPATLAAVLRGVTGAEHPPLAACARFLDRAPGAATLGGAMLRPTRTGWMVTREKAAGPARGTAPIAATPFVAAI
jgi:tRNA(Ile)-lysidine synthase